MLNIVLQAILAVGLAVVAYFDVGGCLSAFSNTQFLSSATPFFLFTTYRAVTPTSEDWAIGPAFTKALSPLAASTSPISSTYFHSNDIIAADSDAVISSTAVASSFSAVVDVTANDILNNISTKSVHRTAPRAPRTSWIARTIVSLTSLKAYAIFTIIAALVFQILLLVVVVGFQRFMGVDVLGRMYLDGSRVEQDSSDDLGIDTLPLQGDHVLVEDEDDFTETPKDANDSAASAIVFQSDSGCDSAQQVDVMVDDAIQVVLGVGIDTAMGSKTMEVLASIPGDDGSTADVIFQTDSSDQRVDVIAETMVPGVGTDILGRMDLDASRAKQHSVVLAVIDERCIGMDTGLGGDALASIPGEDGSIASDVILRTNSSLQRLDVIVETVVPGVGADILGPIDLDASQAGQDPDGLGVIDRRCVEMNAGLGGDAMDDYSVPGEDSSMASDVVFRTDFSDQWVDVIVETMVPGGRDDVLGQMHLDAFEADHDSDGLDMDMLPLQGGRVVLKDRDGSTKTHNDTATDVVLRTDAGCGSDQRVYMMMEETIVLLGRMDLGASQAEQDSDGLGVDKLPLQDDHVVEEQDERNDKAIFRTNPGCDSDQRVAMMVDEMIEESWGGIGTGSTSYSGGFAMEVAMASKAFPRSNGGGDGRGDVLGRDRLEQSIDEDDTSSGSLARIEDYLERAMADGDVMPLPSAGEYDWNSGEEGFEKAFFGDEDDSFTLGRMEIEPRFLERLVDVELPKDSDMSCDFDSDEIPTASPVLPRVDVCTEPVGTENATVEAVTHKDGGGILRENGLEKGDDKVVLSSDVPWHTAADEDIIGLTVRFTEPPFPMTSTPLRFGSRTSPADRMQPSPSPRPHFSNSAPKRPLARSLFDGHDLEVVRRIITQDKRLPLRDLAQNRLPKQPANVRVQKPLPLPGGPPSAPFEGKSNGARKRRLRREALAAQRLEEGLL